MPTARIPVPFLRSDVLPPLPRLALSLYASSRLVERLPAVVCYSPGELVSLVAGAQVVGPDGEAERAWGAVARAVEGGL